MKIATHPRFGGYLPALPKQLVAPRLIAIKVEAAPAPMPAATMFDVLIEDDARLYALPFVERRDGALLIPEAYAAHAAIIAGIAAQLTTLDDRFLRVREASLELFASDPEILAWASQQTTDAMIVPALASYGVLFDAIDRYRYASIFAEGRRVVDLRPGCGYGAVVLGARASSYTAIPDSDESRRALQRFTFASSQEAGSGDVVLAFAVAPSEVASYVERARATMTAGGIAIVTSTGDAGREALAATGLTVERLKRPGLEPSAIGDYVVRIEAVRSFARADVAVMHALAPRPLSVVFVLRPSSVNTFGGDVVQVRETAAALRARGHRVTIATDAVPHVPDGTDVVHVTNVTCPDETLGQLRAVRGFRGPIVMMPIFIDHADETVWGMQAAFDAARDAASSGDLERARQLVAQRAMQIRRFDGVDLPPPPARIDMGPRYTEMQREILSNVDFLIANAYSEVHAIQRHLTTEIPFAIAPSCCDPAIYNPDRAVEFHAKYNLRDFILSTGRLEARKQQLTLLEIARRWPERRLVLIGRNADVGYGAMLRIMWSGNVTVIPQMSEEELAGAYAAARVVAMPSWDEVVSLSSLNAAACGASLVLTRNGYELEYMRDDALYCDPGDTENIAAAIDDAWNSYEERRARRKALSERVRREYVWDRAAEATERAYDRVLADNPRGRRRLEAAAVS